VTLFYSTIGKLENIPLLGRMVFGLSTPTPAYGRPSPIEGGGNYWGGLKYLLLIFNVQTIMD